MDTYNISKNNLTTLAHRRVCSLYLSTTQLWVKNYGDNNLPHRYFFLSEMDCNYTD